jgi:hypothetical protein
MLHCPGKDHSIGKEVLACGIIGVTQEVFG